MKASVDELGAFREGLRLSPPASRNATSSFTLAFIDLHSSGPGKRRAAGGSRGKKKKTHGGQNIKRVSGSLKLRQVDQLEAPERPEATQTPR
eukprot:15455015-Alexandrium_andersonii.AAC.1